MVASSAEPPAVADSSSRAERRSRRLGWWLFFVVAVMAPFSLVVAGAVVVCLWWQLAHIAAINEVKAEVARIQAAGEPITIADWYAHHRVPEGTKDITGLWLAALTACESQSNQIPKEEHQKVPIVGYADRKLLVADIPDSVLPVSEAHLAKFERAIQAVLVATQADGECRYPIPFENAFASVPPHTPQLRIVARIMTLRARVAMARGKYDVAIESIEANLAAARSFEHQPTLVEYLVRVAVAGVALDDSKHLLAKSDLTDEQLLRLQALVQDVDLADSLCTTMLGERGLGLTVFYTFPPTPAASRPPSSSNPMAGGKLTKPQPCLINLAMMQDYIDASREPFPKALDSIQKIQAGLSFQAQSTNPLTRMNIVAALAPTNAVAVGFPCTARTYAVRDLLLLGIAAKRFKLKYGRDASGVNDLVPAFIPVVPTDPFDGQPLRMQVTSDEIVFYSVGEDRVDNGGQDPDGLSRPDLVVRLPVKYSER